MEYKSENLVQIIDQLQESTANEEGYGGQLWHRAEVDGWELRITSSDFGEVLISASDLENKIYYGFQEWEEFTPITKDVKSENFDWEWFVSLFERGKFKEMEY